MTDSSVTSSSRIRFAQWAAGLSICAPFLAVLTYALSAIAGGALHILIIAVVGELLCALIFLLGIGLGVAAVVVALQQQRRGILVLAFVGIGTDVLLVAVAVIGVWSMQKLALSGKLSGLTRATNELASASTEETRFYALDAAAKESFIAGKTDDARRYASELLTLAPKYHGDWNYGNAIQDGHLVLGRLAVKAGNIEEAKHELLEAGKSPGSPQMDSFGPNMTLAKDLLEKGERTTVLQYFDLCHKFWTMDYGKLNQWSNDVTASNMPDFGANLLY